MEQTVKERNTSAGNDWPSYAACVIAFAALAIVILFGFNPHIRENAGSDFKTLYASTWCFVHGMDAYQLPSLAQVFRQNDVIEPRSWYGHSPVYPPITLALLAPVTLLPMVPAIAVWIGLGCAAMALASATLVRSIRQDAALGLPWKLVLVALCAVSPLLNVGLELANVSVVSAALSIFAVAAPRSWNPWLRATALAIALILKPHIALWIVIAFLFSSVKEDRRVLVLTGVLLVFVALLYGGWGLIHHSAFAQFSSYKQIVASELNNGSMSPGNHDVMEVFVQITSLSSLIGYWLWGQPFFQLVPAIILACFAIMLAWASWRSRSNARSRIVENAAAWSAFGMMATYHRDADAMIMILVLPAVLSRLRENIADLWAFLVLAAFAAASVGPSIITLHSMVDALPSSNLFRFVFLRQASIAVTALSVLLTSESWLWNRRAGLVRR